MILFWLQSSLSIIKYWFRMIRDAVALASVSVFSSNKFLAGLYYFLFSRCFDREHVSVLKGRANYYKSLHNLGVSSALLRRNIHRIEKGLIMQPRRNIFAEGFILETVRCYKRALSRNGYSRTELKWASDVLDEYFSVIGDAAIVRKAKLEYSQSINENKEDLKKFIPHALSECPNLDVTYTQLKNLFKVRKSVRWYSQKPVPEELIQQVVNAAALAPSACNRQPFRFIVARNSNVVKNIVKCAGGTAGFADQIPAVIVVVGDLSAYPLERDRHLIYIDSSLASMQLMLAAQTLGLSTCPINWPDLVASEKKLQKIINLPLHERVIMLIAIGYGDAKGGIPYSEKKQGPFILSGIEENDY
jgi:nitroreductase